MSDLVTAFRACAYERPLWAVPNRGPGRWHEVGDPPVQYLALHPMGPWAELLRHLGRTGPLAERELRVPTWVLRLRLAQPPRRIGFAAAGDAGLRPSDLVADDQRACRAAAARLRDQGVAALIVPSAALPGTEVLVLFGPRVIVDYDQEPLDPELEIRAALLQQDGHGPEGLAAAVHHRGGRRRHAGLLAHRAGREHRFRQPPVTAAGLRA